MAADADGRVYLAGGLTLEAGRRFPTLVNDVWTSTTAGSTWTRVTGGGAWPPARFASVLLSSAGGRLLWLTGGNITGDQEYNPAFNDGQRDRAARQQQRSTLAVQRLTRCAVLFSALLLPVWRGDVDGAWSQLTAAAAFSRRMDPRGRQLSFGGGVLLLGGGVRVAYEETADDVWASLDSGKTWGLCVQQAQWAGLWLQAAAVDGDGYVWVMGGGRGVDEFSDEVWKSVARYNNASELRTRCNKQPLPASAAAVSASVSARPSLLTRTLARVQDWASKQASSVQQQ